MHQLPNLIFDLGLILVSAAAASVLFKALRQPLVLGYLLTGFLVGPHFQFFPSVTDPKSIAIWAEIGVIFMLFSLGLEFSFKKLGSVGKSALITSLFELFFLMGLGYFSGRFLGWSRMDSIFLGGILSISSTTIVLKAFDELNVKAKSFVSLVLGVLVFEDVLAVLLLVLLTSIAVGKTFSGTELFQSTARLSFFLIFWFISGIYLLPLLFRRIKKHLSNETLLVTAVGLCLLMVIIASKSGFSPALGAFVMGSLLAETTKGQRIEHLILPVKDLFSAIFFVSVGMLIDPTTVKSHWGSILFLSAVVIFGKFFGVAFGALLSGRSVKQSLQAGLSLGQIGEFSFLIATLGMSLRVTSDFLYPVAVAVSALTTFTTPIRIKLSEPLAHWVERKMPDGIKESLARYETTMLASTDSGLFKLLWREYGIKLLINIVVIVAIVSMIKTFALPMLLDSHKSGQFISFLNLKELKILVSFVALSLSGPFLWAIAFGNNKNNSTHEIEIAEKLRRLQIGITVFRFLIAATLSGFIISSFTSVLAYSGVLLIIFAGLGIFFFSRLSEPIYNKIEGRFLSHLSERERESIERKTYIPSLAPWDAALVQLHVTANSSFILQTLEQAAIKEKFGVTVTMIERGDKRLFAPTRTAVLLPGDRLYILGTDEQIQSVRTLLEVPVKTESEELEDHYGLSSLLLDTHSPFVNKSIRDCGIRDAAQGLIVGIEREGIRYLSPNSSMTLRTGDLIWLVGDREKLQTLKE